MLNMNSTEGEKKISSDKEEKGEEEEEKRKKSGPVPLACMMQRDIRRKRRR